MLKTAQYPDRWALGVTASPASDRLAFGPAQSAHRYCSGSPHPQLLWRASHYRCRAMRWRDIALGSDGALPSKGDRKFAGRSRSPLGLPKTNYNQAALHHVALVWPKNFKMPIFAAFLMRKEPSFSWRVMCGQGKRCIHSRMIRPRTLHRPTKPATFFTDSNCTTINETCGFHPPKILDSRILAGLVRNEIIRGRERPH